MKDMKKFIVYALGITILSTTSCALYDKFNEKKVAKVTTKIEEQSENTCKYNPTLIIHNSDGSLNFIIDPEYLDDRNAEMPATFDIYRNVDGSVYYKSENDGEYNPTLVIHNSDESLNFIIDPDYLDDRNAEMPDSVDLYRGSDGSISYTKKR